MFSIPLIRAPNVFSMTSNLIWDIHNSDWNFEKNQGRLDNFKVVTTFWFLLVDKSQFRAWVDVEKSSSVVAIALREWLITESIWSFESALLYFYNSQSISCVIWVDDRWSLDTSGRKVPKFLARNALTDFQAKTSIDRLTLPLPKCHSTTPLDFCRSYTSARIESALFE